MGLDGVWQQSISTAYQVWVWLKYEASVHPILCVGTLIVLVAAWVLYRMEVRTK